MPLRTTPDKARCAILRRDHQGYNRYQAELCYRNFPQRFVLGMRADYVVVDEAYSWGGVPTEEALANLRSAFAHGAKMTDWTADYVAAQPRTTDIVDKLLGGA